MSDAPMPFLAHVAELRRRLLWSVAALGAATIASFSFTETLAEYLMHPVDGLSFVYLSPPELFLAYVRIAVLSGLVISSPVILFQIWMFVRPGLLQKERRAILTGLFFGAFFFAAGAAFSFLVILPFTLRFFLQYATERIEAVFSFGEYVGFVTSLVLSFGAAFELPVITAILAALGVVRGSTLAGARRYAVLLVFIVAAILTPPDVVSQVLLALPMLLLFEISVMVAKRIERKADRRRAREEAETAEA
ncbi:MAG: twin-arginine translocase subunit TatC [Treponema sp.]|nr:twin-arginine translocase subunit TatC [Treponema sp.]